MRTDCRHEAQRLGEMDVVACGRCRTVEWWETGRPLDPAEGVARAFGSYELIDRVPALRAPAAEVLVYRPPSRRARSTLSPFPRHEWLLAADHLWMCHDGETLQLCPTNPLLARNLVTRSTRRSRGVAAPSGR